ncbi:unnamed protein product [Urochloa decumbens]|uniref:Uncharacterized protein n=1 Tax=Urochloa decumbens TaxID=240449 RepID=A0ABC9EL77_9POAL
MRIIARNGQPHGVDELDIRDREGDRLLGLPHTPQELATVLRRGDPDLDDEEVGPAEVAAHVADERLHAALVELGVVVAHGVGLPLVPQHGGQVAAPLAACHGRPGTHHHPVVELRAPRPVGEGRAALRAGDEPHGGGGGGRLAGGEHGVGEGHAGPNAEHVADVDVGVQRLARLLPAERGGQAEDARRGRALGRDHAVPGAARGATPAAHVGLSGQDEDQRPAARRRGTGREEEQEEEGEYRVEHRHRPLCFLLAPLFACMEESDKLPVW